MSLSDKYQQFWSSPSAVALSDRASINYIPTLTTITEPSAILKHFVAQAKLLTRKNEKVLSAVEGDNGVCLDIETTIEFLAGGGTYLPGLDDNFLTDRTVTFPMIHIVQFDADHKIHQIRVYWDQGSLLKQLDVVGSRGRNWPIRDGKDQSRLIASSAASIPQPGATEPTRPTKTSNKDSNGVTITTRAKSNSNAMNDPHASLSLFEPRDVAQEERNSNFESPNVARRMSAKPPPRDYSELFGSGDHEVATPTPAAALRERSISPNKRNAIPIKRGAGKNFSANRLFDENDEPDPRTKLRSPERVKTDARKYDHFEFGDGEDASKERKERHKSTHANQWDFEDFATPLKPTTGIRPNDQRHFGWSDDEADTASSPPKRPVVHQPRPDAKPHFEFTDEGTPTVQKPQAKTNALNKGLGLYDNHINSGSGDDHDSDTHAAAGPLTEAKSNINRKKDFDAHWEMRDKSPAATPTKENGAATAAAAPPKKTLPSQMQSHWATYDGSPEPQQQGKKPEAGKENAGTSTSTTTTTNENAAPVATRNAAKVRKQTERSWGFGDDGDGDGGEEDAGLVDRQARAGAKKQTSAAGGEKSFWDF